MVKNINNNVKFKKFSKRFVKWSMIASGGMIVLVILGSIFGGNDTATTPSKSKTTAMNKQAEQKAQQQATKEAAQQVAEAKSNELAELQALGDWGISSSQKEFSDDYTSIQNSLNQGDIQGAYEMAKMAASKADQWNTDTMNNQDMKNVPADIPQNVRDVLKNVDPNLADAYMAEKLAFDDIADAINKNDLSKLDDAKTNFQVADSDFANAKAFIDRAQNMLK